MTIEELVEKAHRWRDKGLLTQTEHAAVMALVFIDDEKRLTPHEAKRIHDRYLAATIATT